MRWTSKRVQPYRSGGWAIKAGGIWKATRNGAREAPPLGRCASCAHLNSENRVPWVELFAGASTFDMADAKGFSLDNTIAVLARTPATLDAWLRGLPDIWVRRNEGPDTWSAFDIVGHLIVGERTDWMKRARIILEIGEARPFDRFDRFAQFRESEGKSLEELLDVFAVLRRQNLVELQSLNLQPEDFRRRGTHPVLGVVTLSQLLATWAAHDLTHMHQLSRVMAHQYRQAVGPWTAFLGVLKCGGHSEG